MNFIEWVKQREPEGPTCAAANQCPSSTARTRDRLTRIEAMLKELVQRGDGDATKNRP
jgi:hypothetical protein